MPSVGKRYAAAGRAPRAGGRAEAQNRAPVVILASGDADSTALMVLAATSALDIDDGRGEARVARERLHVLHVERPSRGIDAEEDREFVVALADRYGIPCTIRNADEVTRPGLTDREIRYAAATELANRLSADVGTPRSAARILTAHTADDRAEGFFVNAIRGMGPSGLRFMARRRNRIVRPLLGYTHEELCDLLRMRGIVWRQAGPEANPRRLQAFVQAEVMPVLERRSPKVVANLSAACDVLADEDAYLASVAGRTLRDLVRRRAEGAVALDARKLASCEVAIARRVVRQAVLMACPAARPEPRHVEAVLALVAAGEGAASVSAGVECRVVHGMLFIASRGAEATGAGWLEVPGTLALPHGMVIKAQVRRVAAGSDPTAVARAHEGEWTGDSVLLDAGCAGVDAATTGRLWVEPPQEGDVMCPAGMHGQSQPLAAVLASAKVPASAWRDVPVVHADADGRVLWLAGVCADERALVTPQTELLLELTILRQPGANPALGGAKM